MKRIPFAFRWIIDEKKVKDLLDNGNGSLQTGFFRSSGNLQYMLKLENESDPSDLGETTRLSIFIRCPNKNFHVPFTAVVESASFRVSLTLKFKDNFDGYSFDLFKKAKLVKPENNYFKDGKLVIKLCGCICPDDNTRDFKAYKFPGSILGKAMWKGRDAAKEDGFSFVADDREISVHKSVIRAYSDVFGGALESGMKEPLEGKYVFRDYKYITVFAAVQIMYDCEFVFDLPLEEACSLLEFFERYQIQTLKEKIEAILCEIVDEYCVVLLLKQATLLNAKKLEQKCMDFLVASVQKNAPVHALNDIDRSVAAEIFQRAFFLNLNTIHTVI